MQLLVANGAGGCILGQNSLRAIVIVPRAFKYCVALSICRHVLLTHNLTDLGIGEPGYAFAVRVLVDGGATEFFAGVLEDPDGVTILVDGVGHLRVAASILNNVTVSSSAFTGGLFVVSR